MKHGKEADTDTGPAGDARIKAAVNTADSAPLPVNGVVIGTLADINSDGQPCVTFPGNLAVLPIAARATAFVSAESIGNEVALLFENGDISKPIVMGVIHKPTSTIAEKQIDSEKMQGNEAIEVLTPDEHGSEAAELLIDGKKIDLEAREQIVLRCGKSSITMTSAGKVIVRGTYVSTRSSGANRIKGGSVQIN